jgi:hypothetical protein
MGLAGVKAWVASSELYARWIHLHKWYTQSTPKPLSLCLPCSLHRQLPALAWRCTKQRSKAQGRSHQCASSCDGKRARDTHMEPSAKLITAHKTHHCDGHAPTQTRDYNN